MKNNVEHPTHYTSYPLEVIDMIKILLTAMEGLSPFEYYCLGNEIKYRFRAGLKDDAIEDINKALMYKKFRENANE